MEEEGSCFVILEGRRFEGWFARFVLYRKDWKGRRNRGIVILWRLLSRRLNQTVSIPFVVTKKKEEREKERGKNTLALLSRQPCARMHLVGTRCSSGGRMRNVSFIRSDSVLTGRDISRRQDDLAKGRGVEENETNGARIHHRRTYPDQSARARSFITDKFGQDCSRYEACGPNILLIKI